MQTARYLRTRSVWSNAVRVMVVVEAALYNFTRKGFGRAIFRVRRFGAAPRCGTGSGLLRR